jgi:raffinose/stachyose/melibiose transport system substrate-binding protein
MICLLCALWLLGLIGGQNALAVRPAVAQQKAITLTMGSWRPDDVEQMNRILAKFHEKYPTISVTFSATNPPDYNAVLAAQLQGGSAPDLFYLRSYATSRQLFEQGYLEPLDTLPGLKENFSPAMLAPWATDDGKPYGVPFIATSHGIYYNLDVFKNLGLNAPVTWEELLVTAQKIKDSGLTPFANASGAPWTMAEIVFMNLAPSFIGGYDGRVAYLTGKRCFNDSHIVAVFQAIKDLAPFLPENQNLLSDTDSLAMFVQGKVAMWLGGSWDIPFFEKEKPAFAWTVMAVPPPAGQKGYVTFQLDAGMGLNAASSYKEEAKTFLEWMTTTEFGELLGNELPGFFPMMAKAPILQNEHANTFLALTKAHETDVRFTWDKLMEGTPSAYDLVQVGAVDVVNGSQTPQQAADALQAGLAQWFAPAQTCNKQ